MAGCSLCIAQCAAVPRYKRPQAGFTLVELIIVMVLAGILGAVAAGRFFDRKGFDAAGFAEQSRSMLRHAQKLAIAQNRNVHVRVESSRISLCFAPGTGACPAASRVPAPAGSNSGSRATAAACASSTWFCEGLPQGVTLAAATPLPSSMSFDALGRPVAASGALTGLSLTISGAESSTTIQVAPETGYVH